jgi:phosphoribosylformylglycinamidine cyclo-ligase
MDEYRSAGVDYEVLDRAKRSAIEAAMSTSGLLARRGGHARDDSRGEPAFVFEVDGSALALVTECLGTKSLAAKAILDATGEDHFDAVGYDTVAAIVNDVVCVGALPLVVNAYFATGAPSWMDGTIFGSLVSGFRHGCEDAGATWGGGETPTLPGIIDPDQIDLAGAAVGRVPDGRRPLLGEQLSAGNSIILLESTGIHTNGVSLARQVAAAHPERWKVAMPSGRSFADALMTRSHIYVDFVERLFAAGIEPTYLTHVTGHGWRKLMRPDRELTYRISQLPPVPEVISFLVDQLGLDDAAAYGTFNMGVGFAVYCPPDLVEGVLDVARGASIGAIVAGAVEEGPRRVTVEPVGVSYESADLNLR